MRRATRLDLDPIHLVEHLDPALDLARLRRLIAEAVDEALDLGHALGLVACARLEQRLPGLALDEEVIVVARVDVHTAPRQVRDGRDHAVEEVAVVGDEHHAALVRGEEALEPAERLEIQVVGRLVEQQEIGAEQEQARQRRSHAPSAREFGERSMDLVGPEAEPAEDHLGLGLEPIAAQCLEAVLDLAIACRRRAGSASGPGHAGGEPLELGLEVPHLLEARQRFRQHGERLAARDLLRQIAHAHAAVQVDAPGVRLLDAGEDAAERGLARAVRPRRGRCARPARCATSIRRGVSGPRIPSKRFRARSRSQPTPSSARARGGSCR